MIFISPLIIPPIIPELTSKSEEDADVVFGAALLAEPG
jgi:hypothetical protein